MYMHPKDKYVHCKYCDWKCLKFWKTKTGKVITGNKRLINHVMTHHFLEFEEIENYGRGNIAQYR